MVNLIEWRRFLPAAVASAFILGGCAASPVEALSEFERSASCCASLASLEYRAPNQGMDRILLTPGEAPVVRIGDTPSYAVGVDLTGGGVRQLKVETFPWRPAHVNGQPAHLYFAPSLTLLDKNFEPLHREDGRLTEIPGSDGLVFAFDIPTAAKYGVLHVNRSVIDGKVTRMLPTRDPGPFTMMVGTTLVTLTNSARPVAYSHYGAVKFWSD